MATDVDICNLALGYIGLEPITALGTANQLERTCSRFYAQTRDVYLQEHDWSFAGRIDALTEISAFPDGYESWSFGYKYPADCLKIRRVIDGESRYEYPFVIKENRTAVGEIILTNLEDAYADYTLAITDTTLFDQMFIEGLSHKLAAKIAFPLTKDARIQRTAFELSIVADQMAKQHDSSEQMPEPRAIGWEESRGNYGPYNPYWRYG